MKQIDDMSLEELKDYVRNNLDKLDEWNREIGYILTRKESDRNGYDNRQAV